MSDRAALLAAIIAHPDEDTPRLVYADWLEENGWAKRAAVIREQIEHNRLATADTAVNAVEQFLSQQYADEVTRVNWAAVDADLGARLAARKKDDQPFKFSRKAEGLPQVAGVSYSNNARGFYDWVDVADPDEFLKHADAIFRAAPIATIQFENLIGEQAEEFAASGHLAQIRELSLDGDEVSNAVRALGTHRDAAGVRKLEIIPHPDDAADTVDGLAAGKHWTGLEELEASDLCEGEEPPEDEQLAHLFGRPQFRNLRKIEAWSSGAGDAALRAIVKNMPELRELKLPLNPIINGERTLAAAKSLHHLRVLDLQACDMDGGDPTPLLVGPNFPNLTVLLLEGNSLREPNPKAMAKSERGPGLRVLDLGGAAFTPRGVEALVKCPAVSGLWYLALCSTQLEDEHVERFTRHAPFDRLAYLDLSINDITVRGAKALAAWPGAARLQSLKLWGNPLGSAGTKALAASPHLGGLKYLHANKSDVLKKRFKRVFRE
jgi:uncharacterized protein (TIGR02996 family)